MPYQNITATLKEADIQEIKAALETIQQKLPFLITLSVEERRKLYKMGDKSLTFVNNSLTAAQSNRDILPASFDLEEFLRDYQLAATLTELLLGLRQVTEQVDDTLMAVGSEAMTSSLTVYDYVKTAAKKTPGLKTLAEQLGERFKAIKTKFPKAAGNQGSNRLVDEDQNLVNESLTLGREDQNLVSESLVLIHESQNLINESLVFVHEDQNLVKESLTLVREYQNLVKESLGLVCKAQSLVNEQ